MTTNKGLNAIALDLTAEENGVWVDYFGMGFLMARPGNDNWKKLNKKLEKQAYGNQLRKPKFERNNDIDTSILIECLAYTAVMGWKDVELDGKEIPFSHEKALEILENKRFKKLTDYLLEASLDEERYLEDVVRDEEEEG